MKNTFPVSNMFWMRNTLFIVLLGWGGLLLAQKKPISKLYPNGTKLYEGFLEKGKPVGLWKRYYDTGVLMAELDYLEENDTCRAKLYTEDGVLMALGAYFNKKKEGNWIFYNEESQSQTHSYFVNDLLQGESRILDAQGRCIEIFHWKDGKLEGLNIRYDSSGDKQYEMNYKNDQLDGKVIYFHPKNKIRMEGEYSEDLKVGVWKTFSKSGIEIGRIEYVNGIPTNNDELIEKENQRIKLIQSQKGKFAEPQANY